jgi:hypothetical protein
MTTVAEIIREVQDAGSDIKLTGEYIELSRGKYLPFLLIERVKEHKSLIIEQFQRDKAAREVGFNSYPCGDFFSCQYSDTSIVFIQLDEEGNWNAWRESWRNRLLSESNKDIAIGVTFETALIKVREYLKFVTRGTRMK